ncbi:hypothetical protein [Cyanobacterium aponinum]|uniref:Uncharacterized protein n=1 Tax=Cyanobacterium aponinum AL20115 TaxID=3090662 RepID=A0AAF0ZCM8_9CHRO|nr:hypothetical protein [Cyanobacterium aponinum]WPF87552.1 hypothetical protein SAY89_12125 [Cyanobacterium aponinum AL20115]
MANSVLYLLITMNNNHKPNYEILTEDDIFGSDNDYMINEWMPLSLTVT